MGISYYKCFICGYVGCESYFSKNTGEYIKGHYCDECVDEHFEVAPIQYWIQEDDGTIVAVAPEYFDSSKKYKWAYTHEGDPTGDFITESYFYPIVTYRPNGTTFKKRALERIDKKMESLTKFRRVIDDE